jgi:RNA polymerase sigma-54 factor
MIGPRLELRQGQSLVVTPQLQQAIKLLQLSNLELDVFVEAELERNPLLQRDETERLPENEETAPVEAEARELELSADDAISAEASVDARQDDLYSDASPAERAAERAAEPDAPLVDWSRAGQGSGADLEGDAFDRVPPREKTLVEHLVEQAAIAGFTPAEHAIALSLIDGVDEGGYLRASLAEIADRLVCSEAAVERVLEQCQGFEPTGVFARSVPECLGLQLKELNRFDPAMAALLDNLELLARRDMSALKKACGVDDEDLRDMITELKALTPRPGAAFPGSEIVQTVIPDVFVREDPAGGWRVDLNSDTLPKLLIDQRYHQKVAGAARSDQEKTFVSECMASANWLVKSLDQRAKTIMKVSCEIVRQQDGFLAFGVEHLRPLNLKTVADAIGMHESTVSRVTSNKYVATPRGVFELKFFFTSSIASSDGGAAHSAESVRHKIKLLVEAERNDSDVHSDDRIVEILKEAGVDIARRTVAKYREAMRIPSSLERKRLLKQAC